MGFSNAVVSAKMLANNLGISVDEAEAALNNSMVGGIARVFSVKNEGKYSTANLTFSKKDTRTNEWKTDFQDGFVRLIGQAHEYFENHPIRDKKGESVQVLQCECQKTLSSSNGKVYTTWCIFKVRSADEAFGNSSGGSKKSGYSKVPVKTAAKKAAPVMDELDDPDNELPF